MTRYNLEPASPHVHTVDTYIMYLMYLHILEIANLNSIADRGYQNAASLLDMKGSNSFHSRRDNFGIFFVMILCHNNSN